MGTDWENMLGTSGANVADAFDEALARTMRLDDETPDYVSPFTDDPDEIVDWSASPFARESLSGAGQQTTPRRQLVDPAHPWLNDSAPAPACG